MPMLYNSTWDSNSLLDCEDRVRGSGCVVRAPRVAACSLWPGSVCIPSYASPGQLHFSSELPTHRTPRPDT